MNSKTRNYLLGSISGVIFCTIVLLVLFVIGIFPFDHVTKQGPFEEGKITRIANANWSDNSYSLPSSIKTYMLVIKTNDGMTILRAIQAADIHSTLKEGDSISGYIYLFKPRLWGQWEEWHPFSSHNRIDPFVAWINPEI